LLQHDTKVSLISRQLAMMFSKYSTNLQQSFLTSAYLSNFIKMGCGFPFHIDEIIAVKIVEVLKFNMN
jgi:hypothetical protein